MSTTALQFREIDPFDRSPRNTAIPKAPEPYRHERFIVAEEPRVVHPCEREMLPEDARRVAVAGLEQRRHHEVVIIGADAHALKEGQERRRNRHRADAVAGLRFLHFLGCPGVGARDVHDARAERNVGPPKLRQGDAEQARDLALREPIYEVIDEQERRLLIGRAERMGQHLTNGDRRLRILGVYRIATEMGHGVTPTLVATHPRTDSANRPIGCNRIQIRRGGGVPTKLVGPFEEMEIDLLRHIASLGIVR